MTTISKIVSMISFVGEKFVQNMVRAVEYNCIYCTSIASCGSKVCSNYNSLCTPIKQPVPLKLLTIRHNTTKGVHVHGLHHLNNIIYKVNLL